MVTEALNRCLGQSTCQVFHILQHLILIPALPINCSQTRDLSFLKILPIRARCPTNHEFSTVPKSICDRDHLFGCSSENSCWPRECDWKISALYANSLVHPTWCFTMPFLRATICGYANRNQTSHVLKGSVEVKQVSNYFPKKKRVKYFKSGTQYTGLPRWLSGKESAFQYSRCEFDSWLEKIPWRRNSNPLQYSCLGNPMDRGGWWATVHGSQRLND